MTPARYEPMATAIRRWAPLLAILAGFGLRVYHLGFQELRGDETFGYFFSQQPFGEIVRATLALREPHPVASYFVEKSWLTLAGDSEFALRFVSAWWGVLVVALLYRLGRRLALGPGASALAALLLAASPYAVWHSQDARMYTMSLALTLAGAWLALAAVGSGRWRDWAAYIAVSWLALQTHYFAAFVILAQNLFIVPAALFIWRRPRKALAWAGAQLAVGLLTLPWLILARDTLLGYGGNGDSPAFGPMLVRALSAFAVGETSPAGQRLLWAAIAGLLVIIGMARLLSAGPRQREAAGFLTLYLFLPLLVTWASALSRPIFNERYLVAAAPPFHLLLASAIFAAPMRLGSAPAADTPPVRARRLTLKRLLVVFAAVALLVLQTGAVLSLQRYFTDPTYSKTVGWRKLAAALADLASGLPVEQVRIAQNFPDPTLWYYYRGPVTHRVLPPQALDEIATTQEVSSLVVAGVRRVILPVQPAAWWDDRGIAAAALAASYTPIGERTVAGRPVRVYVRPPEALPAIGTVFAGGLTLEAGQVEPVESRAGGMLAVHLRWQGPAGAVPAGEKLTLQLLNAHDKIVAQTDQPAVAAEFAGRTASYGILLPDAGLAPGQYRVILALYNPEQAGAPRRLTAAGADFVLLATVRISAPR